MKTKWNTLQKVFHFYYVPLQPKYNLKTRIMKKSITRNLLILATCLCAMPAAAQLSSNPDKFLGNITTGWGSDVDTNGFIYSQFWNQITPENSTKWDAIEPSRGNFSYSGADKAANYAKKHHFPFKYHTLIWGAQYPGWVNDLSTAEQYRAIVEYFDGVKEHYPNLEVIDVVNEAITGHQPAPYRAALGGEGRTGYDWIIKAFQLAHERWPNAILVYNDYNSFTWQKSQFIDLVKTLRNAGAPIDAYGHQSHDLTDISLNNFKSAMNEIHTALQMPMYSTEFDIGTPDDQKQKTQYMNLIPELWEADYCAGITLWGWIYGSTWTTDGNSGLIRDGEERPALTWLREYMQTDAAKNAKSPFPGMKKEASIYIRPAAQKVALNDVLPIKIHASLATKTIEKVDFYVNNELVETLTEAPYIVNYTATAVGNKNTKAVVTATDGTTYERYGFFNVSRGTVRSPYNETIAQIPGTINVTEYDNGMSGVAYYNASRSLTSTKDNQWMEYTVDVQDEGYYSVEMEVASANSNGMFHLSEYSLDNTIFYTDFIEVPKTGSSSTYTTVHCPMTEYLSAGRHVFCLNIDKGGFYVKSMTFKHTPTFSLPGTIEAEDFLQGGEGIEIIDANNGYAISNTDNGEWLEYSVNVTEAGKYSCEATVSSEVTTSKFTMVMIEEDGTEKSLTTVSVPKTGKNIYEVKSVKIRNALKAGKQKLRINITGAGCDIDKINFVCTEPTGINEVTNDNQTFGTSYNLSGQKVSEGYRGIIIINGKKVIKR